MSAFVGPGICGRMEGCILAPHLDTRPCVFEPDLSPEFRRRWQVESFERGVETGADFILRVGQNARQAATAAHLAAQRPTPAPTEES